MSEFGIPFAYNYQVMDMDDKLVAWVVKCPVCGVYIEEREEKDEESFTGSEYAEHYEKLHEDDEPPDRDGDPTPGDDPGYRAAMQDAGRGHLLR